MTSPDSPTVVFLHAHPDDEAIFTGGTLRLLADAGCRTVVVFATDGGLGAPPDGGGIEPHEVAAHRRDETEAAAALLGVDVVETLGYADSGLPTHDRYEAPPGSLAATPLATVADRLAHLLRTHGATALVGYDPHGIYGHPDHVVVHRAAVLAADSVGLATRYDATVDREHLHFVETHLVEEAHDAGVGSVLLGTDRPDDGLGATGSLGLAASGFGTPTVLVDLVVDVGAVLDAKRAAMAAHASQIPPSSSALRLDDAAFAEVYGLEWYLRVGPPGPLDALPRR